MVLDEPANRDNYLHPPAFGHGCELDGRAVEYVGWVRIVGT